MGDAIDRSYSYFAYKPDADWNQFRKVYRPRAIACSFVSEFAGVLKEMLTQLKDLHVWIETEEGQVGTYSTPWQRNRNPQAIMAIWVESQQCSKFAIVGKTKGDEFGFVVIKKQSEATVKDVEQIVAAITALHDAPGFIVDLRGGASGCLTRMFIFRDGSTCCPKAKFMKDED